MSGSLPLLSPYPDLSTVHGACKTYHPPIYGASSSLSPERKYPSISTTSSQSHEPQIGSYATHPQCLKSHLEQGKTMNAVQCILSEDKVRSGVGGGREAGTIQPLSPNNTRPLKGGQQRLPGHPEWTSGHSASRAQSETVSPSERWG